jgi:hypothetical protein
MRQWVNDQIPKATDGVGFWLLGRRDGAGSGYLAEWPASDGRAPTARLLPAGAEAAAAWELAACRHDGAEQQAGSGWGLGRGSAVGWLDPPAAGAGERPRRARRRRGGDGDQRATSLDAEWRRRTGHRIIARPRDLTGAGAESPLLLPFSALPRPRQKKTVPRTAPPPSWLLWLELWRPPRVGIWCPAKGT